ncbi:TetR/AcrR family transcriptional regulator [Saccharothrix coeruleofusca]|uniref:TetR family transcriptional regulator n=1 Tax=Saccharothrix coeruleofusca TaxID=33919 RepID=A0A918EGI8_9PSEU|nr:TetR/AcrR family transcriptional regulator [Saccharothrix coeruleofusca]MBP2334867.1 AcrR family transcriptional regulator [Saccharothrix coeruleofusca]GGP73620.1 TetR family transcriptional regulator [Saccharothrix coeruleofusca]
MAKMGRPRKFVEQDAVRAARDQFWDKGYAATSIDDLMTATGLARASLYGAFGDKHALFLRAFDDYCGQSIDAFRVALRGEGPATDRLEALMRNTAAAFADDTRGCMLAKSTAELAGTDEDVQQRTRAAYLALHEAIVDCVRAAQAEGGIDPSADPEQLAGVLLAVTRGMEAIGKGGVDRAVLDAIAEGAIRMLPRAETR